MPTLFISDADLQTAFVPYFARTTSADLAPHQVALINQGNARAHSDIYRILNGKGYSDAQIGAWKDRVQCATDTGLYYAIANNKMMKRFTIDEMENLMRWIPNPNRNRALGLLHKTSIVSEGGGEPLEPEFRKNSHHYGRIDFDANVGVPGRDYFYIRPDEDW